MDLRGMSGLETISARIDIGAGCVLNLAGLETFWSLPKSLRMIPGATLDLRGCVAWDGRLPKGLSRQVTVLTGPRP